jgi:hypothetical protein
VDNVTYMREALLALGFSAGQDVTHSGEGLRALICHLLVPPDGKTSCDYQLNAKIACMKQHGLSPAA